MAAFTTIDDAGLFFNTVLYTGNGTAIGSGGLAVTGAGFQPDFTWIKNREQLDDHIWTDAVRGATKYITSDAHDLEVTNAESLTTWGADGFTLGNHAAVNSSAETYVSWNWKAGTTTGIAGSPSITPTGYSFNATSGFSVIEYAGTGVAGTLPHGLGVAPQMVIIKKTNANLNWCFGHEAAGWTRSWVFNEGEGVGTNTVFNDTAPTSTLFSVGTDGRVNASGSNYIGYCFAPVNGYSAFGKYIGNGNADGTFVYTGFRPAWLMIKRFSTGNPWVLYDNKRQGYNINNDELFSNTTAAEVTTDDRLLLLSNGFKPLAASQDINGSGSEYLYSAFAESPFVNSSGVSTNAR